MPTGNFPFQKVARKAGHLGKMGSRLNLSKGIPSSQKVTLALKKKLQNGLGQHITTY